MIKHNELLAVAMLSVALFGMSGCGNRETAKPPPGVTQEMENMKPPTIELGLPSGSSATHDAPQQPNAKTK